MKFDFTVSLGNVLTIVAAVGGWLAARRDFRDRFVQMETKVGLLYGWWEKVMERRQPKLPEPPENP